LLSRITLCKLSTIPATPDQSILLHNIGIIALESLGLGFGFFVLGSLTSTLWIWMGLKKVYKAVSEKDMWLDTKICAGSVQPSGSEQGLVVTVLGQSWLCCGHV
jgi:hypothetical protein